MRHPRLAQPWGDTVVIARSASITVSQGLSSWTRWAVVIHLDVCFCWMYLRPAEESKDHQRKFCQTHLDGVVGNVWQCIWACPRYSSIYPKNKRQSVFNLRKHFNLR